MPVIRLGRNQTRPLQKSFMPVGLGRETRAVEGSREHDKVTMGTKETDGMRCHLEEAS